MTPESENLRRQLVELHHALRAETLKKYGRMNPFNEDLFAWRERGQAWTGDDRGVTIYNSTTVVGDVQIGEGTWIGPYCSLDGAGPLRIGSWCSISLGCQLLTHDTARWALSGGRLPAETAPTSIGDRTYLGSNVVVVKGVHIGSECVIGAGAIVTHDVPDRSIAVGVPARVIGYVEFDGDEIHFRYSDK
jgi:acetyltransferase-like isoleucine patch superfamily enzyme